VSVDNAEILKRIRQWQVNPYVNPITCALYGDHGKMLPQKRDGQVILVCPDAGCPYEQVNIPYYFNHPGFRLKPGIGLVIVGR